MTAYEWGISPLSLNNMEILDIAYWCLAQSERKKADTLEQKHLIYALGGSIASHVAPLLTKNARTPSFEQMFPETKENSNYIVTQEDVINHLKERRKALGRT